MKRIPSIFNDALGPIMIGASSSHTAASVRIGMIIRQIADSVPQNVELMMDREGSLANTYHDQGADIGFAAGLMGYPATAPQIKNSLEIAAQRGINIIFRIGEFENDHPNTYAITVRNANHCQHKVVCISCGGGLICVKSIDGLEIGYSGENYGLGLFQAQQAAILQARAVLEEVDPSLAVRFDMQSSLYGSCFFELNQPVAEDCIWKLKKLFGQENVIYLTPVMPSQLLQDTKVPFLSGETLLGYCARERVSLVEAAIRYEVIRSNTVTEEIWKQIHEIIRVAKDGLAFGRKGHYYADRILPAQAHLIQNNQSKLIPNSLMNKTIEYVSALMDAKSAMQPIVACPTAGSCGILPGTLIALCEEMGWDDTALGEGLLCAGIIGVLINDQATFSAEKCGCQAECGSSSAMTAAAISFLRGRDTQKALDAAAFALQNMLGLICDPVGMRVEVPCLGKNIIGAMNALAAANMSLAEYYNPIPLDQTIQCMYDVGIQLPPELRCTGKGGLSQTPAALEIQKRLEDQRGCAVGN